MQKKNITKFFRGPPLDQKKMSSPPFFCCHENYGSIPQKSMQTQFLLENLRYFFSPPPSGKNFKRPPPFFASATPSPPPISVCERSLMIHKNSTGNFKSVVLFWTPSVQDSMTILSECSTTGVFSHVTVTIHFHPKFCFTIFFVVPLTILNDLECSGAFQLFSRLYIHTTFTVLYNDFILTVLTARLNNFGK